MVLKDLGGHIWDFVVVNEASVVVVVFIVIIVLDVVLIRVGPVLRLSVLSPQSHLQQCNTNIKFLTKYEYEYIHK